MKISRTKRIGRDEIRPLIFARTVSEFQITYSNLMTYVSTHDDVNEMFRHMILEHAIYEHVDENMIDIFRAVQDFEETGSSYLRDLFTAAFERRI